MFRFKLVCCAAGAKGVTKEPKSLPAAINLLRPWGQITKADHKNSFQCKAFNYTKLL